MISLVIDYEGKCNYSNLWSSEKGKFFHGATFHFESERNSETGNLGLNPPGA